MKAKKTIGIIAVAVMGLMAVAWAADTATSTGQVLKTQSDKGTVCTYDANDNGRCGHWYRWVPGHREHCGWSNCGSWSRGCR